jgi:hypothetical protein
VVYGRPDPLQRGQMPLRRSQTVQAFVIQLPVFPLPLQTWHLPEPLHIGQSFDDAIPPPPDLIGHRKARCAASSRYLTPAARAALASTSSSIAGVNRPVKVFCWLTW